MKLVSNILLFLLALFILGGCQKKTLPVQTHPLKADAVESGLKAVELTWIISDEQSWAENHVVYSLNDEDGRMIAMVTSIGEDNGKSLSITFLPALETITLTTALSEPDIKKAFILAARLYGGLEEETQIYDAFQENFQSKSQVRKQESANGGTSIYEEIRDWTGEVDGVSCFVSMGQQDMKKQEKELRQISLYNNEKFAPMN